MASVKFHYNVFNFPPLLLLNFQDSWLKVMKTKKDIQNDTDWLMFPHLEGKKHSLEPKTDLLFMDSTLRALEKRDICISYILYKLSLLIISRIGFYVPYFNNIQIIYELWFQNNLSLICNIYVMFYILWHLGLVLYFL